MPEKRILIVVATHISQTFTDVEDREIPGRHAIEVDEDTPVNLLASVALDVFHDQVAVGTLDDFSFRVEDEHGNQLVETDKHEAYSAKHKGKLAGRCGP